MTFHFFRSLARSFSGEILIVLHLMKFSGSVWMILLYSSKSFTSGKRVCIRSLKRGFISYFMF